MIVVALKVEADIEPVTTVFPVVFPMFVVPVPPVPMLVVAAPVVLMFVVPTVVRAPVVSNPVTTVFPVALPRANVPVPPVAIVVAAAPVTLIVVVPSALSVVAWTGRGVVEPKPRTGGEAKSSAVAESAVAGEMYTLVKTPAAASAAVAARTVEFCVVGVPVTPGG